MSAIIVCDGCGKQAPGEGYSQAWHKPRNWYERTDKETGEMQTACSRECIEKVAEKTGCHSIVCPV